MIRWMMAILDMNVAGHVGEELLDEVADRSGGEVDGVAVGTGAEVGLKWPGT